MHFRWKSKKILVSDLGYVQNMMDFPCSDLMEAARGQKHPYKSLRGQNNLEGVDLLKKSLPKVFSATSKLTNGCDQIGRPQLRKTLSQCLAYYRILSTWVLCTRTTFLSTKGAILFGTKRQQLYCTLIYQQITVFVCIILHETIVVWRIGLNDCWDTLLRQKNKLEINQLLRSRRSLSYPWRQYLKYVTWNSNFLKW